MAVFAPRACKIAVAREDQQYFSIVVPSRFLEPGDYELILFGAGSKGEERLAVYPFRVK